MSRYSDGSKTRSRMPKNPGKLGFLTLSKQFSIAVVASIILSFIAVSLLMYMISPLMTWVEPYLEKPITDITLLGKRLYDIADNPDWGIAEDGTVPEIDELAKEYPQYEFNYETYPGMDREAFELSGKLLQSDITLSGYTTLILEANNGVVITGIRVPFVGVLTYIMVLIMFLLYLLFLLLFIGLFAHKKVRYLKKITTILEYIAGGDLSAKVPLRGKDEIYQVAYHINEMTTALNKQIEKEKESEETKKQLITNISHDLRTPLTAIVGFLGVLEKMEPEHDPAAFKQYIHRAYEKSKGLSHLVDQLFDYVILSNRQVIYHPEKVEPSVYFLQTFTEVEHLLEDKQLKIKYYLPETEKRILIDCIHFQRVIENLVQNICKYAKSSSEVRVEGTYDRDSYILMVSNEIECNPEDCDNYLTRYFTTDRASGKSAGLGLAICKELIEQQYGTFQVKVIETDFHAIITLPFTVCGSCKS